MNILTGVMFSIFALSYVCMHGSEADSKEQDIYATVCAISFVCMILLVGFWITVFLGRV